MTGKSICIFPRWVDSSDPRLIIPVHKLDLSWLNLFMSWAKSICALLLGIDGAIISNDSMQEKHNEWRISIKGTKCILFLVNWKFLVEKSDSYWW